MEDVDITIKSGDTVVQTTGEGLKQASNEIVSMNQVMEEADGQIGHLMEMWWAHIWKTYKTNGNEIKVSLAFNLQGDSKMVNVKSSISFSTGKVSDGIEAEVKLNQPKLKGMEE